ncbi:TetR/AcrR family transcriptional regulator [Viridibacillus sp. NPDC093762]|uniref:TetR/AcrR family transcriptional regulator n=1 Tax=Viridibacillus sp. NPDC093762 TaxID=3390720 RepID=UPI003CFED10E
MKIVNRRGYEGATMEEIAAELLMTKASLYYYFRNKEDLLFQCHNLVLNQAIADMEELVVQPLGVEELFSQMVALHINYVLEEKETFNLLFGTKNIFAKEQIVEVIRIRKRYFLLFTELITKGIEEKKFVQTDSYLLTMHILGALNSIQLWYQPNGRLSKADIIRHFQKDLLKILK